MADAIGDQALLEELEGENELNALILAYSEWIEWLRDKLYRLALTVPQKHLKHLGTLIDELKTLLPISQWNRFVVSYPLTNTDGSIEPPQSF